MATGLSGSEKSIPERSVLVSDFNCNPHQNHFNNDKKEIGDKIHNQYDGGECVLVCASTRNGAVDRQE
jgi:hypothetical protein